MREQPKIQKVVARSCGGTDPARADENLVGVPIVQPASMEAAVPELEAALRVRAPGEIQVPPDHRLRARAATVPDGQAVQAAASWPGGAGRSWNEGYMPDAGM